MKYLILLLSIYLLAGCQNDSVIGIASRFITDCDTLVKYSIDTTKSPKTLVVYCDKYILPDICKIDIFKLSHGNFA